MFNTIQNYHTINKSLLNELTMVQWAFCLSERGKQDFLHYILCLYSQEEEISVS